MAEYIERDIFINNKLIPLVKQLDLCHPKQKKGVLMAIKELNNEPTADIVEVKHGYYERVSEDTYRCSICRCSPIADINNKWAFTNYCHNCGAKMQPTDFCNYGERKEVDT